MINQGHFLVHKHLFFSSSDKADILFSSPLPVSFPPSLPVCVLSFDGLVSSLCLPLSLHTAFQRRHGPEARPSQRHYGDQGG